MNEPPWWKDLRNRLVQHRFLRSVGVLLGGSAAGQVVLLLVSPLVTRLYVPVEYGALGSFTALLFVLAPVAALRYEMTIPLVDDVEEAVGALVLSFAVLGVAILITAGAVLALGGQIAGWIGAPELGRLLWLLPLALGLGGAYNVLNHWAIRVGGFGDISRSEVSRPISKAATQVGLGVLGWGTAGLIAAEITGRLGGILPLARRARSGVAGHLSKVDRDMIFGLFRRYWRFPVFTGGGTVLSGAAAHMPVLLVAGFFGPQTAGWFALAQRMLLTPVSLFGGAVSKVYLNRAAPLAGREPRQLRQLFLRTSSLLLALGAVPALVLLLAGPFLFATVFGDVWLEAGRYARVLAIMYLAHLILVPVGSTLDLLEKQMVKFVVQGAHLLLVVMAFVVPHVLGRGAYTALVAYSAVVTVMHSCLFVITLFEIGKGKQRAGTSSSRRPR